MSTADLVLLLLGFLLADLHMSLPAIARRVVCRRAAKLPPTLAQRMREEWLAEINASPSHLQKVWFALGLFRRLDDLVRADREGHEPQASLVMTARIEVFSTLLSILKRKPVDVYWTSAVVEGVGSAAGAALAEGKAQAPRAPVQITVINDAAMSALLTRLRPRK